MANKIIEPLLFETSLNWLQGDRGILHTHHINGPIYVSTPEQFGGTSKDWSPEHLLLGAVAGCFMSTFIFFAKKKKLPFNHIECRVIGEISVRGGEYHFTQITVYPVIYIESVDTRTETDNVITQTEGHCLVSNAIRAPMVYHRKIVVQSTKHGRTAEIASEDMPSFTK